MYHPSSAVSNHIAVVYLIEKHEGESALTTATDYQKIFQSGDRGNTMRLQFLASVRTIGISICLLLSISICSNAQPSCEKSKQTIQAQINELQSLIERHKIALERLGRQFAQNNDEIENWLKLSQEGTDKALEEAKSALVSLALSKTKDTLKALNAKGPVSIDKFIKDHNITDEKFKSLLYRFGLFNIEDPTWALRIKQAIDFGDASKKAINAYDKSIADGKIAWTDFAGIVLKTLPSYLERQAYDNIKWYGLNAETERTLNIAKNASLSLALGKSIIESANSIALSILSNKNINFLSNLEAKDLETLIKTTELLHKDYARLKGAKETLSALSDCNNAEWEAEMQKTRLSIVAENMNAYIWLLQLHGELLQQRGIKPSQSGFYPAGEPVNTKTTTPTPRTSTPPSATKSPQAPTSTCPPITPRNMFDALRIEGASHKNVCWKYVTQKDKDGKVTYSLIVTSPNPVDKNYKSLPSGTTAATSTASNSTTNRPRTTTSASSNTTAGKSADSRPSEISSNKNEPSKSPIFSTKSLASMKPITLGGFLVELDSRKKGESLLEQRRTTDYSQLQFFWEQLKRQLYAGRKISYGGGVDDDYDEVSRLTPERIGIQETYKVNFDCTSTYTSNIKPTSQQSFKKADEVTFSILRLNNDVIFIDYGDSFSATIPLLDIKNLYLKRISQANYSQSVEVSNVDVANRETRMINVSRIELENGRMEGHFTYVQHNPEYRQNVECKCSGQFVQGEFEDRYIRSFPWENAEKAIGPLDKWK